MIDNAKYNIRKAADEGITQVAEEMVDNSLEIQMEFIHAVKPPWTSKIDYKYNTTWNKWASKRAMTETHSKLIGAYTHNAIESSRSQRPEKSTEVLYGVENAVGRGVSFMANVKKRMDIYFDHRAPSIVVGIDEYRKGYQDIRKRGGKIRAFTEITKDNVKHCKKLMNLVDELRHLDGVKGGLAVSETEYMATIVLEEAKPLTQVIYSNVKEIVEQGRYIFDTLWNTAIPAEQKIKEIEEGIIRYETRIIEDSDQIIKEISRLTANSNELSTCLTPGGMQYSYNYFFKIKKKLLEKQRKGKHRGIRYITKIERDNIGLVKTYLNSGIQIRHVKNLPPMSFGVSDKEMSVTIEMNLSILSILTQFLKIYGRMELMPLKE
jgi:hypothetical protein